MGRHGRLLPYQAQTGMYEETEASLWRDAISLTPLSPSPEPTPLLPLSGD